MGPSELRNGTLALTHPRADHSATPLLPVPLGVAAWSAIAGDRLRRLARPYLQPLSAVSLNASTPRL